MMNAPLLEIAHQIHFERNRKIRIVDIGAAIGDTALLLFSNMEECIEKIICIEGDPEFFSYLKNNLVERGNAITICQLLSADHANIPSLARIHAGTASAQGREAWAAVPLDDVITERVDLIKIDVDGFDGKVLAGARKVLSKFNPAVIFEWHPFLCKQSGNNWIDHFEILSSAGYEKFVWFTKFGEFSHFSYGYRKAEVDEMAEYCLKELQFDRHYDVIALPSTSTVTPSALARLGFAQNKRSKY